MTQRMHVVLAAAILLGTGLWLNAVVANDADQVAADSAEALDLAMQRAATEAAAGLIARVPDKVTSFAIFPLHPPDMDPTGRASDLFRQALSQAATARDLTLVARDDDYFQRLTKEHGYFEDYKSLMTAVPDFRQQYPADAHVWGTVAVWRVTENGGEALAVLSVTAGLPESLAIYHVPGEGRANVPQPPPPLPPPTTPFWENTWFWIPVGSGIGLGVVFILIGVPLRRKMRLASTPRVIKSSD